MFGGELPYWRAYSHEAERLGLGDAPVYIATGAWESANQTLIKVRLMVDRCSMLPGQWVGLSTRCVAVNVQQWML